MTRKQVLKSVINGMTALGGAVATVSLYFAFTDRPRTCLLLLGAAAVLDSLDGLLTRELGLVDTLSQFDGARLDEYADLVTYVIGPVGFAWATGILPENPYGFGLITGGIVCAASIVQFSWTKAKLEHAFLGWPSYWNVLFFYFWALEVPPFWAAAISLVLAAGVFAPVAFLYPSKFPRYRRLTFGLGGIWGGLLVTYLAVAPQEDLLVYASLFFPAYYLTVSLLFRNEIGGSSPE